MTSCTGSVPGGFGGNWEKSVSGVFASEEEGWLSELAEALRRVPHVVVEGRWKSQHRKIVPLFHVKKSFNSKVIKCFVPEIRSRKCFSCLGIPMLSIYELWTLYVHFTYSCMAMLHYKSIPKHILLITFLNDHEFIFFLHIVKWFQYCYIIWIILYIFPF